MEQAASAYVYPSTPAGWAMGAADWQARQFSVMPIKNGGPGLALRREPRRTSHMAGGKTDRGT